MQKLLFEDHWVNFYCFIADTKILDFSLPSNERMKISWLDRKVSKNLSQKEADLQCPCGVQEGHIACHYWISVLTNWFFPALGKFSRRVLLTFFCHSVGTILKSLLTDDGLEWKRWGILWRIQGCCWFSAIIVTVWFSMVKTVKSRFHFHGSSEFSSSF